MTDETESENENGEIWHAGRQYYVYLKSPKLNKYINRWGDSMLMATYFYPNGGIFKQYCLPRKKIYLNRVIKLLKRGGNWKGEDTSAECEVQAQAF